jgi:hypothetical protein
MFKVEQLIRSLEDGDGNPLTALVEKGQVRPGTSLNELTRAEFQKLIKE